MTPMRGSARRAGTNCERRRIARRSGFCALRRWARFAAERLHAQFQMPDPKQMSGIPRPVDDLPDGNRLGSADPRPAVEQHHRPRRRAACQRQDADGEDRRGRPRASSTGWRRATTVKAAADVDGEHLESQEFPAPEGGIRLMLVATDKAGCRDSAGGHRRRSHIGGQSRIVMRAGRRNAVSVFYLLTISNAQQHAGESGVAVRLRHAGRRDRHERARGIVAARDASTARTSRCSGPFPPGQTFVQVACELPVSGGTMDIVAALSGRSRPARRRRQEGRRHEADVAADQRAAGHAGRRRDVHRRDGRRFRRASRSH